MREKLTPGQMAIRIAFTLLADVDAPTQGQVQDAVRRARAALDYKVAGQAILVCEVNALLEAHLKEVA